MCNYCKITLSVVNAVLLLATMRVVDAKSTEVGTDFEEQVPNIQKLKANLFKDYNKNVRPVLHHTNVTEIKFGIIPLYLVELDEEKSLFVLDARLVLMWVDYRLMWNMSEYDGLSDIQIPRNTSWEPDIVVHKGHGESFDPENSVYFFLYSTGNVYHVPNIRLVSYCSTELNSGYPSDQVRCNMTFSSWGTFGWNLNLTVYSRPIYMGFFLNTNPRWEVDVDGVELTRNDTMERLPFITVTVSFPLKRRAPTAQQVIYSPCVLVMVLTLAMFWIPHGNKHKMTLGSILLLILTLLTVYTAAVTKSSKFPKVAVSFITTTMYGVASAVVLEVILMHLGDIISVGPPDILLHIIFKIGKYIAVWEFSEGNEIKLDKIDSIRSMNRSTSKDDWLLVATAVDRALFVIYIGIFATIHTV